MAGEFEFLSKYCSIDVVVDESATAAAAGGGLRHPYSKSEKQVQFWTLISSEFWLLS